MLLASYLCSFIAKVTSSSLSTGRPGLLTQSELYFSNTRPGAAHDQLLQKLFAELVQTVQIRRRISHNRHTAAGKLGDSAVFAKLGRQ
jgi:hypothetical protein